MTTPTTPSSVHRRRHTRRSLAASAVLAAVLTVVSVLVAPSAVAWHFKRSTGKLPEPYYIYYYVRNRIVFGSRYSSVDPVDIVLDLDEFVYRWRGAVERNAPEWLPVYE